MKRQKFFTVLIAVFVLAVGQSYAQLQWDEAGVPVRKSLHINYDGWTVKSPSGDVYMVWSDTRDNTPKVYGQKYDSDGGSLWGEDRSLQEVYPWMMQIIPTSDDGIILVWAGEEYFNPSMYAQKIDANGNVLWDPNGVFIGNFLWEPGDTDSTDGSFSYFDTEPDASGGVFVTWLKETASNHLTLFGSRLLSDGSVAPGWDWGGSILKDDVMYQGGDYSKYTAHDGENGLIYSWQIYVAGDKYNYAQKVDGECNLQWGDDGVFLSEYGIYYSLPHPEMDGEGSGFLVWTDDRSGNTDLYMQKVDAEGNLLWGNTGRPLITAPNSQRDQTLKYDGEGGFFVAWEDYIGAFESNLSCQHVNADGEKLWGVSGTILCNADEEQTYLKIDTDNEGGIFAIWADFRNYGYSLSDCYMQHVESDGNTSWQTNGIMVSGGEDKSIYHFAVASTSDGGAICPYLEGGMEFDFLKMQKVDENGNLLFPHGETIIETIHGGIQDQRITPMMDENYLVAWTDYRHTNSSDRKIYYQLIDNDGEVMLVDNGLPICDGFSGKQEHCEITGTSDGGAVITWWEWRGTVNMFVYAQKIDAEGNILWNPDGVKVDFREHYQYYQAVCPDDNGGAYVAWRGYEGNYPWGTEEIMVQHLDADGRRLYGDYAVVLTNIGEEDYIVNLFPDGEGGAICVYYLDGITNIYAARVNPDGTIAWTITPMQGQPGGGSSTVAITRNGGGGIVAWEDNRNGIGNDIYMQKFDLSGNMLWEVNGVPVIILEGSQRNTYLAEDEEGYVYVNFQDTGQNYNLYCQRLSPDGNIIFQREGVPVCDAEWDQYCSAVIADGFGGALMFWEDQRDWMSGNNSDIYATHFDNQGRIANPLWETNGNPVCGYPGGQYDPMVVSDGYGGAILVWDDNRCMDSNDLFAQRVNDYIVGAKAPSLSSLPDDYKLYQNYPNPFNNSTRIEYYLPVSSHVELEVFDIVGREVSKLVVGKIPSGYHTVEWNASNVSSGIYFVRLEAGINFRQTQKLLLIK